ncbi:MAG: cytosine permease [Rhodoluna sp.]|nr:cytosine permease [Rhodoluna sp.]
MESNQYMPPVRKSLTDEELAVRVEYATSTKMGIEAMMDLVVAQEALRAQEDLEIQNWLEQMDAEGSPESISAAENFRKSLSGVTALPKVEPVAEPIVEEQASSFSWFTKPEVVEDEVEPIVDQVVEEEVELPVEHVVLEEATEEPVLEEEIPEVQEEVQSWFLVPSTVAEPVGTETEDEFEHLLASAAAEEELTALEESESESKTHHEVEEILTTNTVIPSDEHRNRKPVSQLLVWLGVSATVVPLVLTWLLISLGLSATTILTDLVIGYFVAGTVIATASLAGKRSGLSTSIVSRAIFGVWGNAIPGSLVFISRAALAALLISFTSLFIRGLDSNIPDLSASVTKLGSFDLTIGLSFSAITIFLVAVIALVRGRTSRLIQLILSLLAFGAFIVALVGISSEHLELTAPGSASIGSKESLLGMALVVMVVSGLWVAVAPNMAKAIPMRERGLVVFAWVAVSNCVLPALVGIAALAWLGPRAKELVSLAPLGLGTFIQIVSELPQYSRLALLIAIGLSLGYAILLCLKTAALDLSALVPIKSRVGSLLLSVVAVLGSLTLFALQPVDLALDYLVNVFVLLSALSAGWIGMLVTDVALRRIAYHELSLSRSYGFYKRFSITSISAWLITIFAALALMPIHLKGFDFTGFADESIGLDRNLTAAPIGFVLTLVLGVLLTLIARIPEIRKQEREVLAVEARRDQLNNIFLGQE